MVLKPTTSKKLCYDKGIETKPQLILMLLFFHYSIFTNRIDGLNGPVRVLLES